MKTETVGIRLAPEERKYLEDRAAKLNITLTQLIRDKAFFNEAQYDELIRTHKLTKRIDKIIYTSIAIGYPIYTAGALIFGAIWAQYAWGSYWSWDPKETWALITWFIYTGYLHTRLIKKWRGKMTALLAIVGFVFTMFTFFGVNYLLSGLHSYR